MDMIKHSLFMNRRAISCKLVEDSSAAVGAETGLSFCLFTWPSSRGPLSASRCRWPFGATYRTCRFISCTTLETARKENMNVKIRLMLRNIMLGRLQFIIG